MRHHFGAFYSQEKNWSDLGDLIPCAFGLLHFEPYRLNVLEGLLLSLGGLTESLVRHVNTSLNAFLYELNVVESDLDAGKLSVVGFMDCCVKLLEMNLKHDRVSNAILESVKIVVNGGVLDRLGEADDQELGQRLVTRVFGAVKKELFKSKDVKKLTSGIQIVTSLMDYSLGAGYEIKTLWEFVTKYLIHPFPAMRRVAAEELYLVYSGHADMFPIEIEGLLLEQAWEAPLDSGVRDTQRQVAQCI